MIPACDAWAEIRRAIAAHPQKGSFLDVGGRDGRHAALAEGFRDYTILDLEPHGLYDQIRGDICALEPDLLPDGTIDVLFSTDLLEHVTDPPAAARTIGRLLQPGGLAIPPPLFAGDVHPPARRRADHRSAPEARRPRDHADAVRLGLSPAPGRLLALHARRAGLPLRAVRRAPYGAGRLRCGAASRGSSRLRAPGPRRDRAPPAGQAQGAPHWAETMIRPARPPPVS